MEDEKFYDRTKDFLIWKNIDGDWTTVEDYLERQREKTQDKIFYVKDPSHSQHFIELYRQKGIEVLCADSPLDPFLMQFLEKKLVPSKFQRIDSDIHESLLDKEKEKTILDASGRTEAAKLADLIRSKLSDETIKVEAKSLASAALPGFVMIDENQRRMRDYLLHMDPKDVSKKMNMFGERTFVVNTNSPIISMIQKIDQIDSELAKDMIQEIYQLALLSQREMDPDSLNSFISLCNKVLEKMASLFSKH